MADTVTQNDYLLSVSVTMPYVLMDVKCCVNSYVHGITSTINQDSESHICVIDFILIGSHATGI